jgi:hypothetical protein
MNPIFHPGEWNMAHKVVERIDGPFKDDEEGDVAYVMVYTFLDDRVQSIAFDEYGAELAKIDEDFRKHSKDSKLGEPPSVKFAATEEAKKIKAQKAPPKPEPKPTPRPRPRPEPEPPPKPRPGEPVKHAHHA